MRIRLFLLQMTSLIVCVGLAVSLAQAAPSDDAKLFKAAIAENLPTHIKPNEWQPELMLPITRQASKGVYIGVGTERTFMTVAMNPQVTEGIFIDKNPMIVIYNRINIKLLKMSDDIDDYIWMRSEADYDDISKRAKSAGLPKYQFEWFQKVLRHGHKDDPRGDLMLSTTRIGRESNYLRNTALMNRLIGMAKENLLSAHQLDLRDHAAVAEFRSRIIGDKEISIVDISNAWWDMYIAPELLRPAIQAFQLDKSGTPLILLTETGKITGGKWDYFGLHPSAFLNESHWDNLKQFFYSPDERETILGNYEFGTIFDMSSTRICRDLFSTKLPLFPTRER